MARLQCVKIQPGLLIEVAAYLAVIAPDEHLARSVDGRGEQVAAHNRVVGPPEVGVKMQIDLAVLLGDVAHKAGDLHLLLERLVDIMLGGRIEEPQSGVVHRPDSAHLSRQYSLFLAKRRYRPHQFLMVVYADDKPVAILLECVHCSKIFVNILIIPEIPIRINHYLCGKLFRNMRKDITNVVFDFGGVVAPADLSIVVERFKALGFDNVEKYLNMVRQEGFFGDFEAGLIDKEEFRSMVSKEVGREVSMGECRNAYMGFFSSVPERNLELFRKLRAEGYRLSLLSNTNPFIMEWALSKAFDGHGHSLDEYLDSIYVSYEMKVMKPDEKIFRMMLESEKVTPSQVLFIDDGPKNVAAAKALGINVIQAINGEDWTQDVLRFLA